MKLQTQIPLEAERNQIDYDSIVLLMGSCFAEHIGEKLEFFQFQNLQNPFGIVFHPLAIEKLVTRAINETYYNEEDVFFHLEQWHSFEVHSLLSNMDKEGFLDLLNARLKQLRAYLFSASHIIFTYGTAWVYRFIETDTIVANCHKIPQKKFLKELLTIDEIAASIDNTHTLIKAINPKVNLINTVSPVRHLKDGFMENSRSKAHLISAVHEVIDPRSRINYFPAFEILMDELRDYRFYTEDMLHPNNTAIAIVWERFKEAWISPKTEALQIEIGAIRARLSHIPFQPESEAHKEFLKTLQQKISQLQQQLPRLKF